MRPGRQGAGTCRPGTCLLVCLQSGCVSARARCLRSKGALDFLEAQ